VTEKHEALAGTGRSTLFGYAVLRANFDHDAPSYLDNFSAFVLDVLADCYPGPGTEATVGEAIRETFGFTIPDKVVGHLLRKLVKARKVVAQEDGNYQIDNSARAGLASLRESMAQFKSRQIELLTKFTNFVKQYHGGSFDLISADPSSHLHAFIARHAAPLLRRGIAGQRGNSTPWGELQGAEYLVGSFVVHLEARDAATFGYLIDAVKGAILAGVLEMGPGDLKQSLNKLTMVLDTPVLLSALGYQGTIPRRAAEQMLQLARKLNVRLVCFDHTEKELNGVLDAAIATLRRPGKPVEGWRAVTLHFDEVGATPADIAIAQNSLRSDLQHLGLRIVPRPDSYHQYGLDETALDALLQKELPAQKGSTRLYDLQSISAVHRLRKGGSPDSFERCGYIFVTNNSGLIVVARQVDERHLWPLVMLESEIASLLWVRSPAVAEDLPRQQLLAAVYTGMQPAAHLWMKYVEEIERLEARGVVNPDEAVLFRSRPEARDVLMDVTLGDTTMINAESMEKIVKRVREDQSLQLRHEADSANASNDKPERRAGSQRLESDRLLQELEAVRGQLESERQARDKHIKQLAIRRARRVMLAVVIVVILIFCFPVALKTVDPSVVKHLPAWIALVSTAVAVAVAVLGSIRMFIGGTVLDWLKPIEQRLAARNERRLRDPHGLPVQSDKKPDQHPLRS
jgi:hypothetical protein